MPTGWLGEQLCLGFPLFSESRELIMSQATAATMRDRRAPKVQEERLIRLNEVLTICGKSRSSLYEAIKEGKFPAPH